MKRFSIFLCLITLAVVFMGHKVLAQTSFLFLLRAIRSMFRLNAMPVWTGIGM